MTTDRDHFPDHFTFSQRNGYEDLPEPMRLDQLSDDLRRELCNTVRQLLLKIPGEIPDGHRYAKDFAERTLGRFLKVAAPYWLDISQRPYWFFPRTSQEEGTATQQAMETLRQGGMNGAVTHLRKAAKFINTGDPADSIRESIHAMESVARTIDPASSETLGPALSSLKKRGLLQHKALEKAFQQLYGYTSDEQGIRHALLNKDAADVGLEEAMFMFGACASFAGYLTRKQRRIQEGGGSHP